MMKMKKAMRGISFLLCLGFFAVMASNNVWAKDPQNIEEYCSAVNSLKGEIESEAKGYEDCTEVSNSLKSISQWVNQCNNSKQAYNQHKQKYESYVKPKETAEEQAQKLLDDFCSKYKKQKDYYSQCTTGKLEGTDSSEYYNNLQSAIKAKQQVQSAYSANIQGMKNEEASAFNAWKFMESLKKNISKEVKQCKKDDKNATKTDEKANKACGGKSLEQLEAETKSCADSKACNDAIKTYNKCKEALDKANSAAAAACSANEIYIKTGDKGSCKPKDEVNKEYCSITPFEVEEVGSGMAFSIDKKTISEAGTYKGNGEKGDQYCDYSKIKSLCSQYGMKWDSGRKTCIGSYEKTEDEEAKERQNAAIAAMCAGGDQAACAQMKENEAAAKKAEEDAAKKAKQDAAKAKQNAINKNANDLASLKAALATAQSRCVASGGTEDGGCASSDEDVCAQLDKEACGSIAELKQKIKEAEQKVENDRVAQTNYDSALADYQDCLKENNNDEAKCAAEKQTLEVAADKIGVLGDVDGVGGAGGFDETSADQLEAETRAAAGKGDTRCSGASLTGTVRGTFGIFDYLACKITTVVADVRVIVYIIAGFGMIAFAYSAIIGKMNWKQLANIGIGLFILSMTTSVIEYFAYNGKTGSLPYGSYLPNGHALISGSGDLGSAMDCSESNTEACPDAQLAELKNKADSSSFGWSDLKSALSSARDAVNTATSAYSSVKNTVETTVNAVSNIKDAIENGGNIIDIAATVGTNIENISRSVGTTSAYLAQAGSNLSNSIQDAQMTNEQRAYVDQARKEYEKMAKKCGTNCDNSKCNSAEKQSCLNLKGIVDQYTTSVDQWLNDEGRGGGATILAGIQQTTKAINEGAGVTRDVQSAKNQGEAQGDRLGLGGDLSSLLGLGYAISEGANSGSDYVNKVSDMDYRSQETKNEQAAAEALAKALQICSSKGGTYDANTKKCTKGGTEIDLVTGAEITTTKNADGSTTQVTVVKKDNGSTVTHKTVTNADGSTSDIVVTQNADGSSTTTITENGKTTTYEKDANGNTKLNGVSDKQRECIEDKGGQWVDGQCINETRVSQSEIDCKAEGGTYKDNKCSNPKKAKCTKEGGTWEANGANSKCIELSPEEKCTREEKIYDANTKKCLTKEEECKVRGSDWKWENNDCVANASGMIEDIQNKEKERVAAIEEKMRKCKDEGKICQLKFNAGIVGSTDYKLNVSITSESYECVEKTQEQKANEDLTATYAEKCKAKGCYWIVDNWGNVKGCFKNANGTGESCPVN